MKKFLKGLVDSLTEEDLLRIVYDRTHLTVYEYKNLTWYLTWEGVIHPVYYDNGQEEWFYAIYERETEKGYSLKSIYTTDFKGKIFLTKKDIKRVKEKFLKNTGVLAKIIIPTKQAATYMFGLKNVTTTEGHEVN